MAVIAAFGMAALAAIAGTTLNAQDKEFIRTLGHGNVAEIQASRLALKKSNNPQVRRMANMLIQQHSQAQNSLVYVGKQVGYAAPTAPDATQKAAYNRLNRLSGAAFDKAFMKAQLRSHYQVLALFKKQLATGSQTNVNSFAQRYITDIQNHTDMLAQTASGLGIQVASDEGPVYGTNGKPGYPGKSGVGRSSSASMPPSGAKKKK